MGATRLSRLTDVAVLAGWVGLAVTVRHRHLMAHIVSLVVHARRDARLTP